MIAAFTGSGFTQNDKDPPIVPARKPHPATPLDAHGANRWIKGQFDCLAVGRISFALHRCDTTASDETGVRALKCENWHGRASRDIGEINDRTEKHCSRCSSGWHACAALGLCGFRDASYRSYAERTLRRSAGAAPAFASRLVSKLGPPTRLAPAWLAPLVNSDDADTRPA